MAEELLINVGIGGDNVSNLTKDVDKLGTEIESTAKSLDKLANSNKNVLKSEEDVLKTTQKMKSAFEVVSSTLNIASTDVKMFQRNLLNIKFPTIGDAADKELNIIYNSFVRAQQIGERSFDMLSLATKVFKGDINQVSLAVASYNELFEQNSGVDAITLNTSAFIAMRNQVVATGGSISSLNKEISQMANVASSANTSTLNGNLTETSTIIKALESNVNEMINTLKIFGNEMTIIGINGENFINFDEGSIAKFKSSLDETSESMARLKDTYGNINAMLGSESTVTTNILGEGSAEKLETYKSSITGLRTQITLLEREFELLSAEEREAFGPDITSRLTVLRGELSTASASIGGFATQARGARSGGFDPLSNSIMQVAREMPNFAISANIGFMAISNNLPILGDAITNFKAMQAAARAAGEVVPKMSTSIIKGIFSLGGALTLVSGLMIGLGPVITKAIESWRNAVSKEFKLKLELDTSALKKVASDTEKIRLFANDYNKAVREGNTQRIKDLNEVGKKEYNIDKDRLKAIGTNINAWRDAFKEYLKIAKDTYFNEALAKKKSENELNRELMKVNVDYYEQKFREEGKRRGESDEYNKKLLAGVQSGDLSKSVQSVAGMKLAELYKAENKLIEETKLLNSTKFRNVYTKSTKDANKETKLDISTRVENYKEALNKIDEYNKSFNVNSETRKSEYKNISNEQLAINRVNLDQTDRFLNASNKQQLIYNQLINDARLKDLLDESKDVNEKKLLAETKRDIIIKNSTDTLELLRQEFASQYKIIKDSEYRINNLNKSIYDNNEEIAKKELKIKRSTTNEQKRLIQNEIDVIKDKNNKLQGYRDDELKSLEEYKKSADNLLKDKVKAEKDLADAVATGANIDEMKTMLDEINSAIIENAADASQIVRDLWMDSFDEVANGIAQVGKTLSSLSNISDLMMQTIDNKTAHEKNQLELSDSYQKASSDKQAEMMYAVDKKNYDSKKKLFEAKKAFDIGVVAIEAASSEMGAVKNLISNGGAISPFAWAAFATETALIVATSVASIAEISSRKLEAPVPPNSSSSSAGGASSANIALNPQRTAMTSREENLNMMNQSGKPDSRYSVKVTDINNVQSKVSVRENNSSY